MTTASFVPYLGGEANAQYWGGSGYWGLATRDGTLVTDPVFLEINVLSYYDAERQCTGHQPVLILRKGEKNADGSLSSLYGVAAADGSWYTGLKYSSLVTQSSAGIFLLEKNGDAVMLAPDGQERWRWAADEIPLEALTPQDYFWDYSSIGQWMQCVVSWNENGTADLRYVDLLTGEVTDTVPDVYAPDAQYGPGYDEKAVYYGEGWYKCNEDEHTLTIHTRTTAPSTPSTFPATLPIPTSTATASFSVWNPAAPSSPIWTEMCFSAPKTT